MAATYEVRSFHGSGPTDTLWPANGRYHKGDDDPTTNGATTPVVAPTSGEVFSWGKFHKLKVTAAPNGDVKNLRWFTPGTNMATGVKQYAKKVAAYTQPSSADEAGMAGMTDASTYIAGAPLVVNSGVVLTGTTGFGTQEYVATQVGVGSTAAPGLTTGYTDTYRVDEN